MLAVRRGSRSPRVRFAELDEAIAGWPEVQLDCLATPPRPEPEVRRKRPVEEGVDGLATALKRLRLRPSFGQLRLRRELRDWFEAARCRPLLPPSDLPGWTVPPPALPNGLAPRTVRVAGAPAECTACDPERLTATFQVRHHLGVLELDFRFPPGYPHCPPTVVQRAPREALPQLPLDAHGKVTVDELGHLWRPVHSIDVVLTALVKRFG